MECIMKRRGMETYHVQIHDPAYHPHDIVSGLNDWSLQVYQEEDGSKVVYQGDKHVATLELVENNKAAEEYELDEIKEGKAND